MAPGETLIPDLEVDPLSGGRQLPWTGRQASSRPDGLRLPLIGKYPLQQQVRILLVALGASLILAALLVSLNLMFASLASTQTQVAGDALMHSQRIGKAAPNASYPTLYMWGAVGTARGMLRSIDRGASWVRVNDDAHQYGGPQIGWVTGAMNTYGTVYMSTNGRGTAYGKIDPKGDVAVVP